MTSRDKRRLRFSLKSMLCAIVVCAILLTTGLSIYEWYYAVPSIPLADAVAAFNARYGDDPVGKFEPPFSEAEIVASIHSQLSTLQASSQVKAIYTDVVRRRRIPQDASIQAMPGWKLRNGSNYTVWWINLDVATGKNSGYGLRIRENNSPVAKPKNEPKLQRSNLSWIPGSIR